MQQHALPVVVVLTMITIGIELHMSQFRELFAMPRVPLLGSLIHTLSFPVIAVCLVLVIQALNLDLSEALLAGILLIAACPSGGFSNVLALIARVNLPLSVALTAISSVFSFVSVPVLLGLFAYLLPAVSGSVSIPVGETLLQLFVLIVLPIGVGMAWRYWQPDFVQRHTRTLQKGIQIVLYVVLALVLVENWGDVGAGVGQALPWAIFLCVANISCCYFFSAWAGLSLPDRVTVALEGSIRNLAVALLIAANVMQRMDVAVLPTVYFMAVLIVAVVFAKTWRRFLKA
jgi:BASS family bile acid:Na+ symporter